MTPHIIKSLNLDFASIEIHENFMVVAMDEGLIFNRSHLEHLFDIFHLYFPDKPFGYISNRVNAYSVDPTCYVDPKESPWLAAIGIVCYTEAAYESALFERKFYKKRPIKPFYNMADCLTWLQTKIEAHCQHRAPISV